MLVFFDLIGITTLAILYSTTLWTVRDWGKEKHPYYMFAFRIAFVVEAFLLVYCMYLYSIGTPIKGNLLC